MRYRLNPIPHRATGASAPLRHRLAAFWVVIALLSLPTGFVVAGAIDEAGLAGIPLTLISPASVVVLVNIAASGNLDLGDYAHGQNETLFLAGQKPDSAFTALPPARERP